MNSGLLIRWGSVLPGREEQAIALFDEAVKYYLGLMEAGKIASFEPFLYDTSDYEVEQGFFIVKGPVAEIFAILESDEYKTLNTKAALLLRHLTINLLTVEDGITQQMQMFDKARAELHV